MADVPRLRIGIDGAPLSVERTGVGRYVAEMTCAAAAMRRPAVDLQVLLFQPWRSRRAPVPDDVVAAGVGIRRFGRVPSLAVGVAVRFGLPVPLDRFLQHPDVMWFTRYWCGSSKRVPGLTMIYDLVFRSCPDTVDPGYLPRLRRQAEKAIRSSAALGVISHAIERELVEAYPEARGRTVVIEPGPASFRDQDADETERRLRAFGLGSGYVLHVGSIEPRKNLINLVDAVERLEGGATGPVLVIVGAAGWSNRAIIEAITAAGPRVRHLPYVSNDDLVALYRGAAALASPSHYEGFGLPILEAMAQGTPVACSDIPVFREVGADAVTYFDQRDPDAIASALAGLVADDARRKLLAAAGLERARHYTWERSAAQLLAALARLAGNDAALSAGSRDG